METRILESRANAARGTSNSFDLVIVGAGGAGMICAVTAARKGLRVLIVEKDKEVGGTTRFSVGTIMASQTRQQKRLGIQDSPEEHAADVEAICNDLGIGDDPVLRKHFTENVADTVEFLGNLGVNFMDPLVLPPHKKARLHQVIPTSRAYVARLHHHCQQAGVQIVLNARATGLIVENGRVVGVNALHDGELLSFYGQGGVVLSSGDIGGNEDMLHKYLKTWSSGIEPTNPVNTGDGHAIAAAIGAYIVPRKDLVGESAAHIRFVQPKRNLFQHIPTAPLFTRAMRLAMQILPPAIIRPIMMRFLTTTLGPDKMVYEEGAILVNKYGERFADEIKLPNMLIPKQPDGQAYIVFDQTFATKFSAWPYFISTAPGVAYAYLGDYRSARPDLFNVAPTPEALAKKMGFSPSKFVATLNNTNLSRTSNRLDSGPFYALGPVKTWVLVSPVGLAVNTKHEVLTQAGEAIPGLYAAGGTGMGGYTVTGHGHGLGWAFTSGRLAALEIASQIGQ